MAWVRTAERRDCTRAERVEVRAATALTAAPEKALVRAQATILVDARPAEACGQTNAARNGLEAKGGVNLAHRCASQNARPQLLAAPGAWKIASPSHASAGRWRGLRATVRNANFEPRKLQRGGGRTAASIAPHLGDRRAGRRARTGLELSLQSHFIKLKDVVCKPRGRCKLAATRHPACSCRNPDDERDLLSIAAQP